MKRQILSRSLLLVALLAGFAPFPATAHTGGHPSVHDTVASIILRLKRELTADQLTELTVPQIEAFLTPDEREILGTEHVRFRVNAPVVLTIVRDASLGNEPYWLGKRGFKATGFKFKIGKHDFDTWEKEFPAGEIGLGVHNLTGRGTHYLVLLKPQQAGSALTVTDIYPAHLRTTKFVAGVEPFVDQADKLSAVPAELEGQLLVQTEDDSSEDARLVSLFSKTQYPAPDRVDQVVLTWSGDPRTTQTIQWRTSTNITKGTVRYQLKSAGTALDPKSARTKRATTEPLATPTLVNDPLINRHTVALRGLKPGTTYLYAVGDGSPNGWTEPAEFTTAPAGAAPFSFIYMGDAQNGLDRWGVLLHNAYRARPDAAFYLMAGDLVNRGAERWDWDSFFENSKGVFDRRPIVPVLGNHEYQSPEPRLYLAEFALPRNGPKTIPPERAYSFEYSNAKFIILDSNLDAAKQTAWLEKQLANTKAVWKFVSYHHPAYSSGGNRDNLDVRKLWTPIFDKYHVDLALQGHDHAYLRTYPMRDQKRVASAKDGTVYVISVSGTKHYDQAPHDYTEVGLTKVSTYQVLDIQITGNRLVYRAHDVDGKVRDEFVIEK
jgi:acid phosphatase type 7